jgi:Beta propeller domain
VFFFNQLRGLQVLNVSDAANPYLITSLRMPAVGEDLYLLPGSAEFRDLVLLTRHNDRDGETVTRIRVVRYESGKLRTRHQADVPGFLTDSRMVGNRLILATTEWGWTMSENGEGAYNSRSQLTQWVIRPDEEPAEGESFLLPGNNPVIAAGADWLAAAVTPDNEWNSSIVRVFGLGESGLTPLTSQPIRTAGAIRDKFKMQWRDNVLTTISEKNDHLWRWQPATVLQNFQVWGPDVVVPAVITDPLLGSLELAAGESLYATRFAGDKAYVVTFLQTDPLWVVDLSDPANPVVAGHIEVPGWSTYLEPVGDLLFSVGWESGTIAASLFDVSDPAAPSLLRRVNLGPPGSYSEAAWDEQALKVLHGSGLVLIPVVSQDPETREPRSSVQLLDLDLANKDLRPRGAIPHDFDARRSDAIGDSVVSLSQRVLVTADVTDRDQPTVLAEVSLAWPVDRIIELGDHLIQIENGSNYTQGRATARVSSGNDPESIVSETDLGDGLVRDAEIRGGRLYVLRQTGSNQGWLYARFAEEEAEPEFHLDVYDVSAIPSMELLGTRSVAVESGLSVAAGGLLWPHPDRPAVLLHANSFFWYGWDFPFLSRSNANVTEGVAMQDQAISAEPLSRVAYDMMPYWNQRIAPRVLVFDVSDPSQPEVGEPVEIGTMETSLNGVATAADGIIVAGATDRTSLVTDQELPSGNAISSMYVIEVPATGGPVVRPGIDLPGDAFSFTQLDGNGCLAWTREWLDWDKSKITVSASDGHDAFEVTSLEAAGGDAATAYGRRLFVSAKDRVNCFLLSDSATLEELPDLETRWQAYNLQVKNGVLIGTGWQTLFAASLEDTVVRHWKFPVWSLNAETIEVAADGELLVPFGEYGASRLAR